jgi:hypothetical protein
VNIPKKIPKHVEESVMRRAVRENLYAPEYPKRFQDYTINLWMRKRYRTRDSSADLADLIRECRADPQNACKQAAQYIDWREVSDTELRFALEIVERVLHGDTAYIKRVAKAMKIVAGPLKRPVPPSACEVAAQFCMELVNEGKRPKSKGGFLQSLELRLVKEGINVPDNLHDTLQRIGLSEAWISAT